MNDASQPKRPLLIALAALARNGKDTIGAHLKKRHGFARGAFAQPLYDGMAALYGVSPLEYLEDGKDRVIERLRKAPRELVQRLGDHVRETVGPEILIQRLVERAIARGEWGHQDFVITDLRLEAELEWVRKQGGRVWWIRREDAPGVRAHGTENVHHLMLIGYRACDAVFANNSSVDELLGRVDGALQEVRSEYAR